jgi:translation initiation factor 1A
MYQSRINNGKRRTNRYEKHRALEEPEEGQSYAIAQDLIGNGRLRALCSDGVIRLAKIRGSLRKSSHKIIIEKNDLILVSFRDFEEDKVDVLHKYTYEEANLIMQTFEIPDCIRRAWTISDTYIENKDEASNVVFAVESGDDSDGGYRKRNDPLYPPMDDEDIDAI